jgi:broad specificity phosphatase PhoE
MPLLFIRHGETVWNEAGRLQGRASVGLSAGGRAEVASWRLPAAWANARWLVSPLRRARETAALLTDRSVLIEPRLIEMDWGSWEGRRLAELRAEAPEWVASNEARGLDFRPPGGESPREVCARLGELIADLATDPAPTVAVCHKGVIRAALVLATGWEMRARAPVRLRRDHALPTVVDADGRLRLGAGPLRLAA